MSIEHADFEGIERLALVLGESLSEWYWLPFLMVPCSGGEIVSTFDSPGTVKFGSCKLIEAITVAEDTLLRFSGVPLGG